MIKIPSEILNKEELLDASGKSEQDIDIEITNISLEESDNKSGLVITIDTKLNFVLPKKYEHLMKERVISKVGYAKRVKVNYTYTGIKIPDRSEYGDSDSSGNGKAYGYGNGFFKKKNGDKPAFTNSKGELVVFGSDFSGNPTDFNELADFVGSKDKAIIEGEVFKIDSIPIKNGRVLITILIAAKARTFGLKAFISTEKLEEINDSLGTGDMIRARGSIEYDTYEHENLMMANSVKKVEKTIREGQKSFRRILTVACGKNDIDVGINFLERSRQVNPLHISQLYVQKGNVGFFLLCAFKGLGGLSESVYFSVRNTFSDCADQAFQSETLVVNSKNHQRNTPPLSISHRLLSEYRSVCTMKRLLYRSSCSRYRSLPAPCT